jgi:hypothetical protein
VPVTIMVEPADLGLMRHVLVETARGVAAAARDAVHPAYRRRLLALAGRVYVAGKTADRATT